MIKSRSMSVSGICSFVLRISISLIIIQRAAYSKPSGSSQRPHIILIVADDLGYNDVSFHGSNQIPTPNLDFLAYNGVLLNNYYVSPICTPTRSALMTGRHPIHTGMQVSVIVGDQPYGLPLNETILPQHLNKLGYVSHMVGKWHLGMHKWEYTPVYRGFQSHLGYYQGCEDYYDHTYEANLDQWGMDFRRDKDLLWNYTGQYSTDIFRDEAVKIIENHDKSKPLFLYLPFQAVHSGNGDGPHLQAPLRFVNKFNYIENVQRRIYAGMVAALDDAVGQIYDHLKSTGMLENSIIVFSTDNGGPANGFDFNAANNFPLRGVKATLWEGGVRAVGFLHSPLLETQAYVSNQMLHVCDWLPTLYHAAGGNASSLNNLDGVDAWDMLSKNGDAVRKEMLHNIDPRADCAGIRVGDYKLLIGNVGTQWDKWYPPYQLNGDEQLLHYSNFSDHVTHQLYRDGLHDQYENFWDHGVVKRMQELSASINKEEFFKDVHLRDSKALSSAAEQQHNLVFKTESKGKVKDEHVSVGVPVTVECGAKPANASTNCHPQTAPCLFHIPSDPCEYNNLADAHPEIVQFMYKRIQFYASNMVPPGNKPFDDRGNPSHHGGAWVPWL